MNTKSQSSGRTFLFIVVFLFLPISTVAKEPSETHQIVDNIGRGLELAKLRKQRDSGWLNSKARMTMELISANGDSSIRRIRLNSLEVQGDGNKTLTIFDEPLDIQGAAFLNHSHPTSADDQWLYLPALKRVKRIASQNKSGPFMGSEFAYEDLSSFEIEKFSYKYLGEQVAQGKSGFKVQQQPNDPFSGYTRQIVWLSQEAYYPLKIEFYDRKGSLIKTLTFDKYEQHLGQFWRAHKMTMVNHQTGNQTKLSIDHIEFQTDLSERDFDKNRLKRVR